MTTESTKKCPFCAENIKEEARKCKHCGSMLEEKVEIPKIEPHDLQKKDNKMRKIFWWVFGGTSVLVLIVSISFTILPQIKARRVYDYKTDGYATEFQKKEDRKDYAESKGKYTYRENIDRLGTGYNIGTDMNRRSAVLELSNDELFSGVALCQTVESWNSYFECLNVYDDVTCIPKLFCLYTKQEDDWMKYFSCLLERWMGMPDGDERYYGMELCIDNYLDFEKYDPIYLKK